MSVLSKAVATVKDKKPYIEVKDAIIARSGLYTYTRAEVLARGHKPARVKDFYLEFRPAAVIAEAANLFDMVPVPHKEHSDIEIDANNFKTLSSAIIGGPITVVPMPDGINIGLQGRIVFYTEEAYSYYKAGNNQTSADYESESVLVDNPDEVGYDLILTKILSVNNVAITAAGRGGKDVRIKDSGPGLGHILDRALGRSDMGLLQTVLGIGKTSEKTFSAVVKDSLLQMKGASVEQRQELASGILDRVNEFTDPNLRGALVGVVRDSFRDPEGALSKWKDAEKIIDGIYARCLDAEAAFVAQVKDDKGEKEEKAGEKEEKKGEKEVKKGEKDEEKGEKEEKKGEKDEEKKARSKDTASLVDERIAALRAELPGLVTSAVKSALGIGEESSAAGSQAHRALDSAPDFVKSDESVDFAINGIFGRGSGL